MVSNPKRRTADIRDFILDSIEAHPTDISRVTAEHFGITRQAVLAHIRRMTAEGLLRIEGTTKDRVYSPRPLRKELVELRLDIDLSEDIVWRDRLRPLIETLPRNLVDICQYALTEMLNNVIEHSSADLALITFEEHLRWIRWTIHDDGVGIFEKIMTDLGLDDIRQAILELSKGKLTTDPKGHTGEGVFFTSRVFDTYAILSSDLYFSHDQAGDDWLVQSEASREGTSVFMKIRKDSTRTIREVFDKYSVPGSYAFDRTHVPVSLSRFGNENLVSRSQARRLLARFERFREVFLNFKGVETIGQAFADEIFRVFQEENPGIKIVYVNANSSIKRMIWRARGVQ